MSRCRSCHARIRWAVTERNLTAVPLEAREDGNILIRHGLAVVIGNSVSPAEGETRYVAHFASCPDAARWRR